MKKTILFVLSVLLLTSCGSSETEKNEARRILSQEAEVTNKTIKGFQIDFATTSDGCEFSNDVFYYYYTINEQYITIESIREREGELKESIKTTLESMPETQNLIKHIKTIDGKMRYQYTGSQSHKSFTITLDF